MLARKLFPDNDFIIVQLLGYSFYTLSRNHPFGQLCGYGIGNRGEVEDKGSRPRPRTQKNPRPRKAFSRTEPLEAKDRNARGQGQGPRTQVQAFSKKKIFKILFQAISNSLAYSEFLIGGGLNHKSHEMTSSKFFQKGSFCGAKVS